MDVRVQGAVPPGPFLGARDLFEATHDLEKPVRVRVRDDPDERTWAGHYDDHHVLNISRQAATSIMARELALHEYAHMHRHEEAHPSHTFDLREAVYLGLAGKSVERRVLHQCRQLANHAKDIYADDITLTVGPTDKLVTFLESELAASVADNPRERRQGHRLTAGADPTMTAVNAAFAVALLERHDLLDDDHRIYALAHAASEDAPSVDVDWFRTRFKTLATDVDESAYRRVLVDLVQAFVDAQDATARPAAD
ncbi:DUF5781 family protein [Halocalculus aciditolerans]|uniref:Uncharacterized protein n=1 Tax=Halocalculus aciditolerans TaxID=1383812 RepID=A0A830F9J6_9EURY|nr:DUF5781 family protein [Halocalculus aciditolerans]GGL67910.1 hypothetical protein GCM10009039_27320 [Halocalculus aciditolerans]